MANGRKLDAKANDLLTQKSCQEVGSESPSWTRRTEGKSLPGLVLVGSHLPNASQHWSPTSQDGAPLEIVSHWRCPRSGALGWKELMWGNRGWFAIPPPQENDTGFIFTRYSTILFTEEINGFYNPQILMSLTQIPPAAIPHGPELCGPLVCFSTAQLCPLSLVHNHRGSKEQKEL